MTDTSIDGGDVRIAIVGMGAVFPGARNLDAFWRNVAGGVDAIGPVPGDRIDPVYFEDGDPGPERFTCRRGGFVDGLVDMDPARLGLMPNSLDAVEPDQLVALATTAAAIDDAGGPDALPDREKVAVIIGRGGYIGAGMARLDQLVRGGEQVLRTLRELAPDLGEDQLRAVRQAYRSQLGAPGDDTGIGLVPNLVASRIANRFDLRGPAYTVDAACASSLVALAHGVRELASGDCDLALVGGVHHCHDVTLWSVFTRLGAVSRSGRCRPFDRDADGLLIGEGTGILACKRLDDAERDGDRVYAVVRGVGTASDGKGATLMSPAPQGQVLAMRRAWAMAGFDPRTVGLLEAHGTGTPIGDAVELRALAEVFGPADVDARRVPLGSVKSMIGHAMPAAGAAGLIKAALAVHHRTVPPTLHVDEPHDELATTMFRPAVAEEWAAGDTPRRAAVSAFGFGGTDAHVVLEEHRLEARVLARHHHGNGSYHSAGRTPPGREERLVLCAGDDPMELLSQLDEQLAEPPGTPLPEEILHRPAVMRLAIVAPSRQRVGLARHVATHGTHWAGGFDIFFSPDQLLAQGGKLAFLFPGVEAEFAPRCDDVAAQLGWPPLPDVDVSSISSQAWGVFGVGKLLDYAVRRFGVVPHAVAGHSIGEWSAMVTSGMVAPDDAEVFLRGLDHDGMVIPSLVFAAVGASAHQVETFLEGQDAVVVSHDNCPHQSIVCGPEVAVDELVERLRKRRIVAQTLPFRSGFHTPMYEERIDVVRHHLRDLPISRPTVPMWSATTCSPYPDDPDRVRELTARHLLEPVRFRELALALHDDGVRVFVQVGVGSLAGFVDDSLTDRLFLTVAAAQAKRDGISQLLRVAAALWTEGADVDFAALDPATGSPADGDGPARPRPAAVRSAPWPVQLGAPLVSLAGVVPPVAVAAVTAPGAPDPAAATASSPPPSSEPFQGTAAAHAASPSVAPLSTTATAAAAASAVAATGPVATLLAGGVPSLPEDGTPLTWVDEVSVARYGWLMDHCLYRHRGGPDAEADRYPVVPMTVMLRWMLDAVAAVTGRLPVGLERVRAMRWLAASPPVTVVFSLSRQDATRVKVVIEGYAKGTVVLADGYPTAPVAASSPRGEPVALARLELYEQRWMFHGPRFQSVDALTRIDDGGVQGRVRALETPGTLLDGVGQLLGYWANARLDTDRIVLPMGVERVRFFGPEPAVGTTADVDVTITASDDDSVNAQMTISAGDRVWAAIEGWRDYRFETDDTLWAMHRFPEYHGISDAQPAGWFLTRERWQRPASRDVFMHHYLTSGERERYAAMNPLAQREWLLGRMAAKDAVRHWLWSRGAGPLFPSEIVLDNGASGEPVARGPWDGPLHLSLSHSGTLATAIVDDTGPVGIDIEAVAPRSERFTDLALTPGEQALTPKGEDRDHWVTRCWVAKEAAAKATGQGLGGNPRSFEVVEVDGASLRVGDHWVNTEDVDDTRGGTFVVGWVRTQRS